MPLWGGPNVLDDRKLDLWTRASSNSQLWDLQLRTTADNELVRPWRQGYDCAWPLQWGAEQLESLHKSSELSAAALLLLCWHGAGGALPHGWCFSTADDMPASLCAQPASIDCRKLHCATHRCMSTRWTLRRCRRWCTSCCPAAGWSVCRRSAPRCELCVPFSERSLSIRQHLQGIMDLAAWQPIEWFCCLRCGVYWAIRSDKHR